MAYSVVSLKFPIWHQDGHTNTGIHNGAAYGFLHGNTMRTDVLLRLEQCLSPATIRMLSIPTNSYYIQLHRGSNLDEHPML